MKNKKMQLKDQYEDSAQSASSFTTKVNLNFNDENGDTFNDEITSNFGDASIFFSENLIIENKSNLETQVDKSNIVLFEKKSIIEDLRFKIFEFESNVVECDSKLKKK
jgi:hypothetical protein